MCLQAVDIFPGCPVEKLHHGNRLILVLVSDDNRPGVFRHVSFLQFFESGIKNSLGRGNGHKANHNLFFFLSYLMLVQVLVCEK